MNHEQFWRRVAASAALCRSRTDAARAAEDLFWDLRIDGVSRTLMAGHLDVGPAPRGQRSLLLRPPHLEPFVDTLKAMVRTNGLV